jgi:hypothetical protein
MISNKKRKRIQTIDQFEFEAFVRTHLATDLADTLLLKLGIRSYNGLIKCENLNDELLSIYDSISENDRAHLFLYHNTLSSSRPIEVIPGILRELILFQEECKNQINNRKIDQIILSGKDRISKRK